MLDRLGPADTEGETVADDGALDAAAAESLLDRLTPLLSTGDPQAADFVDETRRTLAPLGPEAARLAEQIDAYDFEPALETIRALRARLPKS